MAKHTFHSFSSPQELARELAQVVAHHLQQEIAARGQAVLVVSGGSTPEPFFRHLAKRDIAWDRVSVTLADERWVAPDHPDSNELLVRSLLLQDHAAAAHFVPLKNSAPTAQLGEEESCRQLNQLPRPFTAVILGLGSDGHTASLFPGVHGLATALDLHCPKSCQAITPPEAPHERMTLTLPALLDAGLIVMHIKGEKKRAVLEMAMAEGPESAMPVRAVLRKAATPVHIYWSP